MNNFTFTNATYYGGFDPGSGLGGLELYAADRHLTKDIDSCIAIGNADDLLARGDINAKIADVIRPGESLVTLNGSDYYLEDLAKEGKNATYELANPARYWSDHGRVLLLALASQLIPDRIFTLRLVTALPVTLYDRTNRKKMKDNLSGYYRYTYNGREREAYITIGYVAMEGQGVLIHAGMMTGEQAVIDIGERTTDLISADGQKLIVSQCAGNQELGVGLITDAVDKLLRRYGRVLSTQKIHDIMKQWAQDGSADITTPNGILQGYLIDQSIDKARNTLATLIISFASSTWNVEGESVGQRFSQITVAGGGAYYLDDILPGMLPHVIIPSHPEHGNLNGYADLALTLEDKIENVWVA